MLNKKNRIGDRKIIESLFRSGDTFKDKFFVFKYKKTTDQKVKFALSVSKKNYKKASQRNKQRRRIYEAIRLEISELKGGLCAFLIVRSDFKDMDPNFDALRQSIRQFLVDIY